MRKWTEGIFFTILFFTVTVILHEGGHLIVARLLISSEAEMYLPFKEIAGYVTIPAPVQETWRGVAVAIAGPGLAAALMTTIWFTTENIMEALISSFFAVYQIVYTVIEPLWFLGCIPFWAVYIPLGIAGVWVISYAKLLSY